MKAILHNLTNMPVTVDGQTLIAAAQPLGCKDPLPAPLADSYLLVPACMASAALERSDVVWSAALPRCAGCAPAPTGRPWLAKLVHRQAAIATLHTIEHYTPDEGRQAIGTGFFRQHYLA